jgi:hypothetical protein
VRGETKWATFSAGRVVFWICITVLAFLFGWLASVTFVAACSLYANIASDFAAFRADRNTEIIERLDRIEKSLEKDGARGSSPPAGPLQILLRDDDQLDT